MNPDIETLQAQANATIQALSAQRNALADQVVQMQVSAALEIGKLQTEIAELKAKLAEPSATHTVSTDNGDFNITTVGPGKVVVTGTDARD